MGTLDADHAELIDALEGVEGAVREQTDASKKQTWATWILNGVAVLLTAVIAFHAAVELGWI